MSPDREWERSPAESPSLDERVADMEPVLGACEQETCRLHAVRDHLIAFLDTASSVIYAREASAPHACIFVSENSERALGYRPVDLTRDSDFWESRVHPEDASRVKEALQRLTERGLVRLEYRFRHADGSYRWIRDEMELVGDSDGSPREIVGNWLDITDRKDAERRLRSLTARLGKVAAERQADLEESQRALFTLMSNLPGMAYRRRNDERWTLDVVSHGCQELTGYSPSELLGNARVSYTDIIHPLDRERVGREVQAAVGENRPFELTYRITTALGVEKWVWEKGRSVHGPEGDLVALEGFVADVTKRRRAEEALRISEADYRGLFENIPAGVFRSDREGRILSANPALVRMLGYESEKELCDGVLATDLYADPGARGPWIEKLEREEEIRNVEVTLKAKNGQRIVALENTRLVRDEAGGMSHYEGSLVDITEARELADQLRQAQKMEAVGQLAGGVAHDFNNLLTAIKGYGELTLGSLDERDPLRRNMEEIRKATDRAESLTRQLLAFSRKQVLQPRVLDLGQVVSDLEKLLRRLIGEDIELRTIGASGLGRVKADPGQIEQVIMNLAVNARDAMPRGGKLTIELENAEIDDAGARQHIGGRAGPYVVLSVSDTGDGMDSETRLRIFEPFFTTKGKGKGTGLGLSTVYGIVKQSGGNIWVYSERGRGSTFRVYLPRVEDALEGTAPKSSPDDFPGGEETILVAEDDEAVRALVLDILRLAGYRVLESDSGSGALLVSERHSETIDLLLTDVIMPGMAGPELFARLSSSRPDMRVLYMSGYTDDAIAKHGILEPDTPLLQKPFTVGSVLRKVRQVLDAE